MKVAALCCVTLVVVVIAGACVRKAPPRPTAKETAYKFRDIFPFPVIGDEGLTELQKGYFIYAKGEDFNAAAAEFERVARQHPQMTEARLLQGIALVLADRDADAIPLLEGVVVERPGYAPAQWFLGQAYFAVGRDADAIDKMKTVVSINGLYAKEAHAVLDARDGHG